MAAKVDEDEFWFDEEAADLVCDFFAECLVHIEGEWAGEPLELEVWQRDIIRPLFGWKRADGTRRYRTLWLEIPRKNGKSTIAAGIALVLLFVDGEPGAQVFGAASDRDQAKIIFRIARAMVENEPELDDRSRIRRSEIEYPDALSFYRVLSAEAYTKHGLNAHGIVVDEVHAQKNRDLIDVLHTSTGSRRQPLVVYITTAGFDRDSICYEMHEYGEKVLAGEIEDPTMLVVIFAADPEDDWTDPATWRKANPNYGISIKEDYLERECAKARAIPAYENTFKRLHLNIWTEQSTRWLSSELWDSCAGEIGWRVLRHVCLGRECWAGLDLSSRSDLTALVLLFPPTTWVGGTTDDLAKVSVEDPWIVLPYFWMPEENVESRKKAQRAPYDVWVKAGAIEATPGNIVDYDVIRARISGLDVFSNLAEWPESIRMIEPREPLSQQYFIREIAYDKWNSTQLATQLVSDGHSMVQFIQGMRSFQGPTAELSDPLLLGQKIVHGGHPVLDWMARNIAVQQDAAGNMKPDRSKSNGKIDGMVSLIMALGRAVEREDNSDYYDGSEAAQPMAV